jgi:hypothetical protein
MLMLVLVLALVPVLVPCDGTKMDHVMISSNISVTSSGSGVRSGASGTAILSDLGTEVVVVVVPGTGEAAPGADAGRSDRVGDTGLGAQAGACSYD